MPKRKKGKLEQVGSLLSGVYPAPDQLATAKVFAWWSRAVPARIVKHARPVKLVRGLLVVHVSSAVWANELQYLAEDLLQRLRAYDPKCGVHRIRFQVGPLPDLPKRDARTQPAPEPVRLAALPEELGRALSRVADDALRKQITEAATTSLARTRKRS